MPQPEQAAVGSDTEAPMSTGHGHHAGARAPGSRLLGDDASTGAKELPAPARWINASIEDHPAGAALQVAPTYTLAFALDAQAASNLAAGGSAPPDLPTASAEYLVIVQLDRPDFPLHDPVPPPRPAPAGLSPGIAPFPI